MRNSQWSDQILASPTFVPSRWCNLRRTYWTPICSRYNAKRVLEQLQELCRISADWKNAYPADHSARVKKHLKAYEWTSWTLLSRTRRYGAVGWSLLFSWLQSRTVKIVRLRPRCRECPRLTLETFQFFAMFQLKSIREKKWYPHHIRISVKRICKNVIITGVIFVISKMWIRNVSFHIL